MQNKLQELTEQLYNEGLSKGREEGGRLLEEARQKSEAIIEEARRDAASIRSCAEKEAEDLKAKAQADIRMASAQCLQSVRKDVENLIVAEIGAQQETSNPEFLKEIIRSVASSFTGSEEGGAALVLPENLRTQLEPWVKSELSKYLSGPVEASFSKRLSGGFTIGPKDGSYYISMTDKTFDELIASYLRPVTRKLLFGE